MKSEDNGDLEEAISLYTEALAIDSLLIKAYIRRGHTYDKLGDPERAMLDYDEVLKIDPDNARAYFHRGFSHLVAREDGETDPAGAVREFTKAVELGLDNAKVYYFRADARKRVGDLEGALLDYKKYMFRSRDEDKRSVQRAREEIRELEKALEDQ